MRRIISLFIILLSPFAHGVCPDGNTYPVTLTFDDGPHTALTPKVLDVLEQEKVKGTFFVLGEHFAGGKTEPRNKIKYEILDRMKKSGHVIGSHTYSHINHPQFSNEKIKENIYKPNNLLSDYLSPVLRLPYGAGYFKSKNPDVQARNDFVMSTIKESGFKHVAWNIDTNDWDPKKRAELLPTMLRDICRQKGGIILFHDIHPNTVDNLQNWIRAIKAEGHSIVGLDHFVPEAKKELPEEACLTEAIEPEVDRLGEFIKQLNID